MRRALRFALAWLIVLGGLGVAVWAFGRFAGGAQGAAPDSSAPASAGPSASARPSGSAGPSASAKPSASAFGGPTPPADAFPATVMWVSDGDTIGARTADRTEIQVRLIGIDAPETKRPGEPVGCYGPEASAELARLLPKGARITAAYQSFRVDRYRRDLWDVWLPDGRLVQGVLVAGGFARTQTWGGTNRDAPWLASLERAAQVSRTGLWGACPQ